MFFIISVFYSRVIVFFVFFAGFSIFEAQINCFILVLFSEAITAIFLQKQKSLIE
jgi:hypothetical protein